ncbi:MAG: glycine C-acetyltransferase [Candidatus Eisenbacteria bacterium]|uniref:2-amino-3-ketobutyrate coenzyme A ligase n=1 Tax=Eiseniibacteriota bacterium TaxID=2212470 RepID=A0A937X7T9_UNCEI|nr:glycine C-acetyltransferase [Candidatus Eisenbacteria bacterium]
MYGRIRDDLVKGLEEIRGAGLYKEERVITTHQGARIKVSTGQEVLNFCANNYLGLSSHPRLLEAAHAALDRWGYGMSSVRFICGTQEIHKTLERKVADFLGKEDCILYAACFDANGGVFEPFMDKDTAILTDALNHASVIDGIRLTKAQRHIVQHLDLADMEAKLKESQGARYRLIATDGVFSMDGDIAPLKEICDLAEKYDALVMVDDSHATGFMGRTGRGTHEYRDVMKRVDLITTTFGKALGGASGGCVAGPQEMIDWLRQKSRPYLFSNTLPPIVAAGTCAVMDLLSATTELRDKLERNQRLFRKLMTEAGFDIRPGDHPIVPIMFGKFPNDAPLAQEFARRLLAEGIYVIGFSFPVVPRGQARIRVQLSAAHEDEHIRKAVEAFTKVGKALKVIA